MFESDTELLDFAVFVDEDEREDEHEDEDGDVDEDEDVDVDVEYQEKVLETSFEEAGQQFVAN